MYRGFGRGSKVEGGAAGWEDGGAVEGGATGLVDGGADGNGKAFEAGIVESPCCNRDTAWGGGDGLGTGGP